MSGELCNRLWLAPNPALAERRKGNWDGAPCLRASHTYFHVDRYVRPESTNDTANDTPNCPSSSARGPAPHATTTYSPSVSAHRVRGDDGDAVVPIARVRFPVCELDFLGVSDRLVAQTALADLTRTVIEPSESGDRLVAGVPPGPRPVRLVDRAAAAAGVG